MVSVTMKNKFYKFVKKCYGLTDKKTYKPMRQWLFATTTLYLVVSVSRITADLENLAEKWEISDPAMISDPVIPPKIKTDPAIPPN